MWVLSVWGLVWGVWGPYVGVKCMGACMGPYVGVECMGACMGGMGALCGC